MSFGKGDPDDEVRKWTQTVRDIMDEMMKRSFVDFRGTGCLWKPNVNVYESRDRFHICVELSGVDRDQIDVECVAGARLRIRGRREQPRPPGVSGPLSVYVLEVNEGVFEREIELPEPVDLEHSDATYAEGYLWITLPRIKRT